MHDRAMMYYRMLQSDVNAASQVPNSNPTPTPTACQVRALPP